MFSSDLLGSVANPIDKQNRFQYKLASLSRKSSGGGVQYEDGSSRCVLDVPGSVSLLSFLQFIEHVCSDGVDLDKGHCAGG